MKVHRGFYGIGSYHLKKEENLGTLMRTAVNFGADFCFTIGKRYVKQPTDTLDAVRNVPVYHYDDMEDFVSHLPQNCMLIGIEQHAKAVNIAKFSHPVRACYLLGAEDYGLQEPQIERCHGLVEISSKNCLNVAIAGGICLYDRWLKTQIKIGDINV